MFKLALTNNAPASSPSAQRGFGEVGAGAQMDGDAVANFVRQQDVPRLPLRQAKGFRAWLTATFAPDARRGFPTAEDALQERPDGSMPARQPINGLNTEVYTPYYSRGSAAFVQNYGQLLYNPIGAGNPVPSPIQASYGQAAQYINGVAYWANQVIPTSVNLQGLQTGAALEAVLGTLNVQAAVRVS